MKSTRKRKVLSPRARTAYHEAGHVVLSAAIGNKPQHLSIRPDGRTLGRSGARMSARPTARVQVHLAGFAAEHLLAGRRPRQLDQEVGFAVISRLDPALRIAFADSENRDGQRAVEEVLRMGLFQTGDEIKREIDRFYELARQSLSAVWSAVEMVAKALLKHEELDRDGVDDAIGNADIYSPVVAVQRAHRLLHSDPECSIDGAPGGDDARQWDPDKATPNKKVDG